MLTRPGDKTPSDNVLLLVARVEPNPQCVISLDFCTRKARVPAQPDPRYGPWRKSRSISMPDDAVQPRRPDVRPRGPSMHASCSRGASLCRQAATSTRLLTASASLTTRPPPCTRSYLGSCSSGNDELARPSRAADDAARSERVCRCSRQSRVFTLDEAGGKGVVCSCVAAVDVLGHLSAAMWQARLVGTTAWWCGRFRAS